MPLDFTAIDFETANHSAASACAVGLAVVRDGRVVETASWLIKPPPGHDLFHPGNIRIHGIEPHQVRDARDWAGQLDELLALAGTAPLVAHNAGFDMGVIRAISAATGTPVPERDYFCSVQVARRTYTLDSYRLPVAAMAAGFDDFPHHDAWADAQACAAIIRHAAKRHGASTVEELLAACRLELRALRPAPAPAETATDALPASTGPVEWAVPGVTGLAAAR